MPIQVINDISLYYEIHGKGEPLVLIGGLTADHQVWKSALKQQLHAVLTHDISEHIHRIVTPTLVIAGEEDCLMPPKVGKAFADALPNAQFTVIKEAAHMPHVEQAAAFTDVILAFLTSYRQTTLAP